MHAFPHQGLLRHVVVHVGLLAGSGMSPAALGVTTGDLMQQSDAHRAVEARAGEVAPHNHPLHDYFQESLGIIDRLLGYATEDLEAGLNVSASGQMQEARFLTEFLAEEIEVVDRSSRAAWREIDVTRHGLKGDGVFDNGPVLRQLLQRETNGYMTFVFPAGEYYFRGEPGQSVVELVGLRNLRFVGQGHVRFLCDASASVFQPTGSRAHDIRIEACENIRLENITLDNRPVPYTVGRIVGIPSGNEIEIEILASHLIPDASYHGAAFCRGLVHDPKTGRIRRDCGDPRVTKIRQLGPRRFHLTLDDNALSGAVHLTTHFPLGHVFSLHPRERPGSGDGLAITQSRHLTFSRVNMRSADSMLCRVATSAGIKFLDCSLEPEPGRMVMNNADAFHCRSNRKGIYLERCRMFHMNDDCMNFYSAMTSVGEVDGARRFVLAGVTMATNVDRSNFQVGDPIAFMNPNSGEIDAVTTIELIEPVSWGGRDDIPRLVTADAIPSIIGRVEAGRPIRIKDREYTPSGGDNYREAMAINAPFEHMIINLAAKNDGFIVRNCEMGWNRAAGFKCKGTNGVVRNTRFHDQLIIFKCAPDWREATYPRNLEFADVVVDRGVTFHASWPDRRVSSAEVGKYMRRIHFVDSFDAQGNVLIAP